jgi:RNA 3'-phosphate cyclase
MEFVEVDGSQGEGGGQIIRTAVAFAAIMRKPVRVVKVRAGRGVPGLKRQHVSALRVLSHVFGGEMSGVKEGSSTVTFVPGTPQNGTVSVDMGTAASITLVLQAVIPAVAITGTRLSLDLVGGTDVPWSPTLDYFRRVVREAYASWGVKFDLASERRGYYPRGGGKVSVIIEPSKNLIPIDLVEKQNITGVMLASRCGRLPRHVADRQLASAAELLESSGIQVLETEVSEELSDSPGSSFLAYFTGKGVFLGSDSIGARGKPAEEVGREAAKRFAEDVKSGASFDSNLADMVIPLLSLAHRRSRVRIPHATSHLKSGLHLAEQFTSCTWSIEEEGGSAVVGIEPHP